MLQSTLSIVTVAVLLTQENQGNKVFSGLPALSGNKCLLLNCSDNQDKSHRAQNAIVVTTQTGERTSYYKKKKK